MPEMIREPTPQPTPDSTPQPTSPPMPQPTPVMRPQPTLELMHQLTPEPKHQPHIELRLAHWAHAGLPSTFFPAEKKCTTSCEAIYFNQKKMATTM
jgi:hypothetical protein